MRLLGEVIPSPFLNRRNNGKFVKARIDAQGMELHAAIPKNIFDFDTNESVWVCFAPDAPHPLCGKRCRVTETKRRCLRSDSNERNCRPHSIGLAPK